MTPEEFDAIDDWDENYRYELVNGVLIVVPPVGAGERSPNDKLGYLIQFFQEMLPIWIGLGRAPDVDHDVPAIVVEFVSRSRRDVRRDYVQKRLEYLEAGVREYWVIDRFRRRMTVFRADGSTLEFTESETYQPPLMPGFELPLPRLFAAADRHPG
jgi:Uma2 family endonuclease